MSYIEKNKEAWEEAFDNRINGWGDAVVENLQASSAYYIQPALQAELDQLNLAGKHVAQFCCSNGRELLSISRHYGAVGTGFDIAENLIAQGQMHAKQLHVPCSFSAMNILDIGSEYHQKFDVILFTIGAITWFQDVNALFQVVSDCLKPKGIMLIHDFHPLMNMLPLPGRTAIAMMSSGCWSINISQLSHGLKTMGWGIFPEIMHPRHSQAFHTPFQSL